MAGVPDQLSLRRHRDPAGLSGRRWARWTLLALVAALPALGLLNVFGQHPQTAVADGPAASLEVHSPERLRSGLYYQSRFTIEAHREIENATLVLDPGWLEGMTLNTLEPAPIGEASRNGRIALALGRVPAGDIYRFFLQFQVNPTNLDHREQDVELHDGETPLVRVDRTVTVYP